MNRGRIGKLVFAALLASLGPWGSSRGADAPEAAADPWTGKSRADVIQVLGEPSKAKRESDGGETLTYSFRRIPPNAPPHPDALLLYVPGVGLVAKIGKEGGAAPMTNDAPRYDEQGRPVGAGPEQSYSAGSSYDLDSGKVTHTASEPDNPEVKGKVKVRFILDAGGTVTGWSASNKK